METNFIKQKLTHLLSMVAIFLPSHMPQEYFQASVLSARSQTQETKPTPKPKYITIKAVGDIVAGTNFPDYRLPKDPDIFFPKSVKERLRGADILFGNYESTLTNHPHSDKDISQGMVFAFRSPPEYAKIFPTVGFDVMSIANNHSMDFGGVGFKDTAKHLNSAGIKAIGVKNQIVYTKANNISIAWLGFCFYSYCNTVQDLETAKKLVEQARQKAEIVIISMHVGGEGKNATRVKNQTEFFFGENRGNSVVFAQTMIDAGADLILGHGPHVPRAMEVYKGKLIAYSLGNFLGYKTFSTTGDKGKSMILEVKLNQEGDFVAGNTIPLRLNKQGIPHVDESFQTVKLVSSLIKSDFPNTPLKINSQGKIIAINKN